jgi:hypothetical protein
VIIMRNGKPEKKTIGKPLQISIFLKEKAADKEREKAEQIERMIEAKVEQALRCLLR